jgi:hypothetical protein
MLQDDGIIDLPDGVLIFMDSRQGMLNVGGLTAKLVLCHAILAHHVTHRPQTLL